MRLVLIRPAALGAGTRPAGFVIGTAEPFDVGWNPATVQATQGVEPIELRNALLNPHLIELR